MHAPPPQAVVLGAALAVVLPWNFQRSLEGKETISQWIRPYKKVAVPLVICGACYLAPHWWHD